MRRLYVKDIPKQFCLRTLITGMGAQHLRSLFMPSSIQMPTATGKLEVGKRLQCEAPAKL
jgi:hypothetical protein